MLAIIGGISSVVECPGQGIFVATSPSSIGLLSGAFAVFSRKTARPTPRTINVTAITPQLPSQSRHCTVSVFPTHGLQKAPDGRAHTYTIGP